MLATDLASRGLDIERVKTVSERRERERERERERGGGGGRRGR